MSSTVVEFFNTGQAGLNQAMAAARLAGWHLEAGRRVLILASDQAQALELDRLLWALEPGSFWPHALANQAEAASEPIVVADQLVNNPNQATVLISVGPPPAWPPPGFAWVVVVLPPAQGPELQACRDGWRALKEAGEVELKHAQSLPGGLRSPGDSGIRGNS